MSELTATEQEYDEIIAPMLAAVAERCKELGMSLVARVEWQLGESGITFINVEAAGIGQQMTNLAANAHGNFDALGIAMLKRFDCSQSAFLARYKGNP